MAEKYRAAGILIYGDPRQYAPAKKFPTGRWLPDDGVQRGSIKSGKGLPYGDPMSGGYPAKCIFIYSFLFIQEVPGLSEKIFAGENIPRNIPWKSDEF